MMMYQQLEAQRHFSNLGRNNVFFVLRGSPAAYPRQLKGTDTNCLVRICSAKAPPTRCLRKPTSPYQAVDSRQSSYIAHDPCCSTTKLVFPDGGMPLTNNEPIMHAAISKWLQLVPESAVAQNCHWQWCMAYGSARLGSRAALESVAT